MTVSKTAPDADYSKMARLYDLVMVKGRYYNYREIAAHLEALPGARRILELGIGTGLVPEQLLLRPGRPDYEMVTGVDLTPKMLDIAGRRLAPWGALADGGLVDLHPQDVTALDLPGRRYDAVFSYGGPWYWVPDGGSWLLVSHIPGDGDNARGLSRAAAHLAADGRLLLGIQAPHQNYARALGGTGMTYEQEIEEFAGGFRKRYRVIPDGEPGTTPLVDMTLDYRVFGFDEVIGMLAACGLSPVPAHGPMFLEFAPARV
jgi:hypothetical protein